MEKDKPTVEDILEEFYPKCEKYYDELHSVDFANDDKYYELDFKEKLKMPKEFADEGVVLPTARDMVDTFVDHIDINNARVFVNKKGTSKAAYEEAEMLRKFYLGVMYRTNVESDISPWRVAAKHYAKYGLGVFKTVWDADRWVDKPEKNDGESDTEYATRVDDWRADTHESLPIVIQAINPSCVYPDPSYGGRQFVIEKQERKVFDIKRRWPEWSNPKNKKVYDNVTYLQYWDNKYKCYLLDGEPVLKVGGGVVPHNYGFIPYVFLNSGLGDVDATDDPRKRYVGIIRYIFDLLIAESRDFSISDCVLKKTAWPWGTIEDDGSGMASTVTKIDQQFGTYTPLPRGVKLVNQTPQIPPEALNRHLERTSSYISAHAAPNSVRGLPEQGVRSGADRQLVIAEAASRYQYSTQAFKHGTAKVLINCARLVKNVIPGNFDVWARTPTDEFDIEIKKERMKEPFTCYVEFAPISEIDEYRRHDDLERLVAGGIVTRRWAREQMSNVDPMAMELDEEREKLRNDPALQQTMSQYLQGKLAEAISVQAAKDLVEGQKKGEPLPPPINPMQPPMQGQPASPQEAGRQIIPPIPQNPALGSSGNLDNQLAGIRSQTPQTINQGMGGGGNRP